MTNFIKGLQSVTQFPGGEAISGQVFVETKQGGVAYKSRVQVSDRTIGAILGFTVTNAAGQARLIVPAHYASQNNLLIVALDDTGTYNAVVADRVQAELMP